jgi:hypothetical protein
MRFEILWVVARHAMRLIRSSAGSDAEFADLRLRLAASAPTFGRSALLDQLLLLRGSGERAPAAYDALLDDGNPFREWAVNALAG